MKIQSVLSVCLLAVLALGRVIHPQLPSLELSAYKRDRPLSNSTRLHINGTAHNAGNDPWNDPNVETWGTAPSKFTDEGRNEIWESAVCRGEQLHRAMLLEEEDARKLLTWPHVQSEWDGDLKEELKKWGYSESDQVAGGVLDTECNFAVTYTLSSAFKDLNIDTRPAGMGGPNRCYKFSHRDGPTVLRRSDGKLPHYSQQYYEADGKKYRARICERSTITPNF